MRGCFPSYRNNSGEGRRVLDGFLKENGMEKLRIGDAFPALKVNLVNGGTLELPGGLAAKYNVVVFFRGHW